MGRLIYAISLIALFVAATLATWPQVAHLHTVFPFAQLVSVRGAGIATAAVLIVVVLLLAIVIRPARGFLSGLVVVLVLYCVANTAVLATRGTGSDSLTPDTDNTLTVAAWNTLGDAVPAEKIAAFATANGVDVLSLPETTQTRAHLVAAQILAAGGPAMTVHSVSNLASSPIHSTSLLLATSLGDYSVTHALGDTTLLPSLVAVPDGDATRPTFVAVHTTPPVSTHMGDWRDDLGWVERLCDQPNVILAGDFNATVDHFPADLGCSDAAQFTGAAALGTWSTSVPSLLGAPIDHVLYSSSWRAVGVSITTDNDEAGSDHRPLTTRLTPAR